MSSYYFVRTPLQYLNALEARLENRFQHQAHHLILLSDFNKTLTQLDSIIRPEMWTDISYIWKEFAAHKKSTLLNGLALMKRKKLFDQEIKKIQPADVVFWSNINSNWFFYIYKKLPNTLYFLDDGFATLNHLKPFDMEELKKNVLSSKSGKMERFLLQTNYNLNWERLVFYTNLSFYQSEKKTIFHHYQHLSELIPSLSLSNEVYFIGQPLIYRKLMSKENYVSRISKIFEHYQSIGLHPIYVPHRSTPLDYIPDNWRITELDYPMEFMLMLHQEVPSRFATFYSSALYNLEILSKKLDISFDYWVVNEEEILNYPYGNISYLYELLQQTKTPNRHLYRNEQADAAKVL
jgi:hypothetical protein